jgi:toluene monooxygenase electron transfer component
VKVLVSAKNQAHSFLCDPGERILYAGLRSGIGLPYECGTGTCGTCKARLVRGQVTTAWREAPGHAGLKTDQGDFLMCQASAAGDCTVEVASIVKPAPAGACLPVHVNGVVQRWRALTHDVAAFEVDLDRPLDFEAGQFMVMTVPGIAGGRAYSMVNYDRRAVRLSFVVKRKPGGRLSDWLFEGEVEGRPVQLFGPLGQATFHPDAGKHVLCIAGGSGIAGMMSILSRACQERYFDGRAGWVFFGVRTVKDLFFAEELAAFKAQAGDRLTMTVALSEEDVDPAAAAAHPRFVFARGLVHAVAGQAMKGAFKDVCAYAAGPPPMVDATLRMLLLDGRLTTNNIRYDKFS